MVSCFFLKIMQVINISEKSCKEKITLQDLARNKFPCKILQGTNFLARSCKEKFSLQDLARNKFPCKILQVIAFLQGSCKILARNAFSFNQGMNGVGKVFCFHFTSQPLNSFPQNIKLKSKPGVGKSQLEAKMSII